MNRFTSRLLSILLILLLGLSPMQSVLANVTVPADSKEMPCHLVSDSSQFDMMSEQSNNDCDQCETASSCNSHCAYSILGLLANFSPTTDFDAQPVISRASAEVKSLQPSALFRPPRS